MKNVNRVAVLGAGVMGGGIACHLANAGLEVLLLDIVHPEHKGESHEQRNKHTSELLKRALSAKPAALFDPSLASRIKVGNLEDDLDQLAGYDWIIEVVIERLDIKQALYERIEQHRKPSTLVTTNTSGIPIHQLIEGRSEDFKRCFFGTHFFNPPRYLQLLEVIPNPHTDRDLLRAFSDWAHVHLGKQIVPCKDTPAFIANRIGVISMGYIYQTAGNAGLPLHVVDRITGSMIGRPKTGTFRLGDLVGLDVAAHVIKGIKDNCPDDKMAQALQIPDYLLHLLDQGYFGNKSGQGFFLRTKERDDNGRAIIKEFDLRDHTYKVAARPRYASIDQAKQIEDTSERIRFLLNADDAIGNFLRDTMSYLFAYSAQRIPEISDSILPVDDAMRAGYGWQYGPFEYWDLLGHDVVMAWVADYGHALPTWVAEAHTSGMTTFYRWTEGRRQYWDISTSSYHDMPAHPAIVTLKANTQPPVYQNDELVAHDIGDGVLCLEFKSKMNAMGEGILRGIQESITLAEEQGWKALVIGNEADNFTVGANLMMVGMMAFQQQYDMLNMAVRQFQKTTMRCRYSQIPVVAATRGYVFGGGCELIMHCDAVMAAAESYIGLVEVGVGLIPGGGGTKEFALRFADGYFDGDVEIPRLIHRFKTIATGDVATSAYQGFEKGYLIKHRDRMVMHRDHPIGEAKRYALYLAEGYRAPTPRQHVRVLGRAGMASLMTAANELKRAGYASEHDVKIANKIAHVLCGGDLTAPQEVSEQYLLDLEREAFLSLCTEPKTMERIQHMLDRGKPLRN